VTWISFLLAAFLFLGLGRWGEQGSGKPVHLWALAIIIVTLAVVFPGLGHLPR
jgi:hypothetical protein